LAEFVQVLLQHPAFLGIGHLGRKPSCCCEVMVEKWPVVFELRGARERFVRVTPAVPLP
jgi:hypothetical protein